MSKITKDTLVPLGLALSMIGGGAGWVTKQEMAMAANRKDIDAISTTVSQKFDGLEKMLLEISNRLGRIEGQLKRGNRYER